MGKGKDAKKNVKKAPAKTAKEKKAEKRLKKTKQNNYLSEKLSPTNTKNGISKTKIQTKPKRRHFFKECSNRIEKQID